MSLVGDRIRERRREAGMKQRDLASKTGLSAGAVGMYETGKRVPDIDTLKLIANALETSRPYLLGDTSDPRPLPGNQAAHDQDEGQPFTDEEELDIERAMGRAAMQALREREARQRNQQGEKPDQQ